MVISVLINVDLKLTLDQGFYFNAVAYLTKNAIEPSKTQKHGLERLTVRIKRIKKPDDQLGINRV